jgi:RNA polymerase sigma-70 factor, ECF subfamily
MVDDSLRTSVGMLEELRDPANREAFAKVAHRYRDRIFRWCRAIGLQEADAEDVCHTLILKLTVKLRTFVYDREKGRFRDWLHRVTYNACLDFLRSDESLKYRPLLGEIQARADLENALLEQSDFEAAHAAVEEVRKCTSKRDWFLFEQVTYKRRRAARLAQKLRMSAAAVHQVVSRVRRRLRAQVKELGGEGEPER